MTYVPGPQLVSQICQGIILDSSHRDLHFLLGESRLSYHQSLVSQYSPLLRELLEERLPLGLQEVTVLLDPSLAASSLSLLMDFLYTGQCVLDSREQVVGLLELRELLQLEVSLELPREDDNLSLLLPSKDPTIQEVSLHQPGDEQESSLNLPSNDQGSVLGSYHDQSGEEREVLLHLPSEDQEMSLDLPCEDPEVSQQLPSEDHDISLHLPTEDLEVSPYPHGEDQEMSLHLEDSLQTPGEADAASLQPPGLSSSSWDLAAVEAEKCRLASDIPGLLVRLQQGALEVACTACREPLGQKSAVPHYKEHLQDLAKQVERIIERKRGQEEEEEGQSRKRRSRSPAESGGKRRRSCDPGQAPATALVAPAPGQRHSEDEKLLGEEVEVEEVAGQLSDYVEEGSKEYRHEVKKARDRLYRRLKRDGQPINIKKHEVEAEMLSNFRARMGRPLKYHPEIRRRPPYTFSQDTAPALPLLDTMDNMDSLDTLDTMEGLLGDTDLENLLVNSSCQGDALWNQEDDLLAFLDPHLPPAP